MKYFHYFLLSITFINVLSGCSAVDVSPSNALTSTASQLGVEQSDIIYQQPARFALAVPGSRFARFQLGLYTQTKDAVVLFSFDSRTKSFKQALSVPISQIHQAAIESWGMFNHLKQLQITENGRLLAINFNNSSVAMAGTLEETEPAYKSLLALGVAAGSPYGRVLPSEIEGFSVPIMIPSR